MSDKHSYITPTSESDAKKGAISNSLRFLFFLARQMGTLKKSLGFILHVHLGKEPVGGV